MVSIVYDDIFKHNLLQKIDSYVIMDKLLGKNKYSNKGYQTVYDDMMIINMNQYAKKYSKIYASSYNEKHMLKHAIDDMFLYINHYDKHKYFKKIFVFIYDCDNFYNENFNINDFNKIVKFHFGKDIKII